MIAITSRDQEIIFFLKEHGFATFGQIRRQFFPSASIASRRLRNLIKIDILESVRLGAFYGKGFFPAPVNLSVSPNTKIFSLSQSVISELKSGAPMQKKEMLLHQLYLLSAYEFIIERLSGDGPYSVTAEETLKRLPSHKVRSHQRLAPDLSFKFKSSHLALELERTEKANDRYRDKIFLFEQTPYTHVLYVALNEKHMRQIMKKMKFGFKYGFCVLSNMSLVYSSNHEPMPFLEWHRSISQGEKIQAEITSQRTLAERLSQLRKQNE